MEDYLRNNLENGEQLLWTGGSASEKIFDNTYRVPYLLRFLISYGLVILFMVYAAQKTGELRFSVILLFLVIGSMIPFVAVSDGMKSRTLGYAATDRKLITMNGSMMYPVNYDEIGECEFREEQVVTPLCSAAAKL